MKTREEQVVADDLGLWKSKMAAIDVVRTGLFKYRDTLGKMQVDPKRDQSIIQNVAIFAVYAESHLGGLLKEFKNLSIKAGERRTWPYWMDKKEVNRAILLNKYENLIWEVINHAVCCEETVTAEMVINKGSEQRLKKSSLARNSNRLIQPQGMRAQIKISSNNMGDICYNRYKTGT